MITEQIRNYYNIMKKHDEEVRVVEVLPSSIDDGFEFVKVNGRLGIRMKSDYTPLCYEHSKNDTETRWVEVRKGDKICIQKKQYHRCRYCGSKSETTELNCVKCGAPLW